jgi:hypothetical protein
MSAWGYTLRPFTADELAYRSAWAIDYARAHPDAPLPTRADHDAEGRTLCQHSGKCREPASWHGTYCYVTGRAGRVSAARKTLCQAHADDWRTKHGAVEVEGPGRPASAAERAVVQFLGKGATQ